MNKKIQRRKVLGRRMADIRSDAGLTQTDLADQMGTDRFHVSKIENGAINYRIDTFLDYLDALSIDLSVVQKDISIEIE